MIDCMEKSRCIELCCDVSVKTKSFGKGERVMSVLVDGQKEQEEEGK